MNSKNLQKVIELRHTLHAHPELSLHERMTLKTIKQFILQNTTMQVIDRDGWLYAVKEGTDKAVGSIAFRADMDALPIKETIALPYASECDGVSHKCGHDGHSAALCGLALELDAIPVRRTVYLIFQPAEEIGAGGEKCSKLIMEKNIDEVYAFHNLSGYPEGTVVYRNGLTQPSSEGLKIRLLGRESHASAPEEGTNPSAAISRIALCSEEFLSKEYKGMVLCTVVGITVGTGDFGISAGSGEMKMTLRAEYEDEMKTMEEGLKKYALKLADEYGLKAEFEISDYFPETKK